MTAKGKITAAALAVRVAAGEPIRILVDRESVESALLFNRTPVLAPAQRKTGVMTLRALAVETWMENRSGRHTRQRFYRFTTSEGILTLAPAETVILAPEDAAAIKRAHAEALDMNAEYDRMARMTYGPLGQGTGLVHLRAVGTGERRCGATSGLSAYLRTNVTCAACKAADKGCEACGVDFGPRHLIDAAKRTVAVVECPCRLYGYCVDCCVCDAAWERNQARREAERTDAPPAVCNAEAPAAPFTTREEWLTAAVEAMRPMFAEVGETIPAVRVSVGWPDKGGHGRKNTTIGQCWASFTTADKVAQIFISPTLDHAGMVLATLAHELVHAVDDCKSGHKGRFAKIAKGIGLAGKMTATHAGSELAPKLATIAETLGAYPHAKLTPVRAGQGEPKQTTRMIKCECGECGYIARTTRKNLAERGAPICPCNREPMSYAA